MNGPAPDTPTPNAITPSPYQHALEEVLYEYQAFLSLTQRVQADLRSDAADLKAQEGWDLPTQRGIDAWIDDTGNIFRFLKRNDFDEKKAYSKLLDALVTRVERALHQPIPAIPPYSASEVFHILPLPEHTDILGRPIAMLCPREVKRNENGDLEDLVEWTWWCCETLRRTLQDYWEAKRWGGKRKGSGGEGCVVIVDAAGAGYRNLVSVACLSFLLGPAHEQEVELLPTLTKVGSRNFPGMVQAVFIVNAGWTQRNLWSIVRKVVPKTAVERIKFIDKPGELKPYFDLAKVPQGRCLQLILDHMLTSALCGTSKYSFTPTNPILEHYSAHALGTKQIPAPPPTAPVANQVAEDRLLSRNTSFASTAELFYTAQNSPTVSRAASHADLPFLSANRSRLTAYAASPLATAHPSPVNSAAELHPDSDRASASTASVSAPTTVAPSRATSTHTLQARWTSDSSDSHGPLSRIKSLTDFKLYLSPSRLAQVDLLDDENEIDINRAKRPALIQRRRTLRPAVLDQLPLGLVRDEQAEGDTTIAQRRIRPPLSILGPADRLVAGEMARSYSDRLMQHHAVELHKLDELSPDALKRIASGKQLRIEPTTSPSNTSPAETSNPAPIFSAAHDQSGPTPPHDSQNGLNDQAAHAERISAFSRSLNPYYGYPALRSPTSPHKILPAHPRRKRDLVKTLLFLFILRLQTLRDAFERTFGLNRLLPWADLHNKWVKARNPEEGLLRGVDPKKGSVVKRTRESDWVWMGVGLLLLRGGWERLIAWPLEILGWDGVRALFGLA